MQPREGRNQRQDGPRGSRKSRTKLYKTLVTWDQPENKLKPKEIQGMGSVPVMFAMQDPGDEQYSRIMMEEWIDNYMKERKSFVSVSLFAEVKLKELFELTANMPLPNPIRTAVCLDLYDTVVQAVKGEKLRNLLWQIKADLLPSIFTSLPTPSLHESYSELALVEDDITDVSFVSDHVSKKRPQGPSRSELSVLDYLKCTPWHRAVSQFRIKNRELFAQVKEKMVPSNVRDLRIKQKNVCIALVGKWRRTLLSFFFTQWRAYVANIQSVKARSKMVLFLESYLRKARTPLLRCTFLAWRNVILMRKITKIREESKDLSSKNKTMAEEIKHLSKHTTETAEDIASLEIEIAQSESQLKYLEYKLQDSTKTLLGLRDHQDSCRQLMDTLKEPLNDMLSSVVSHINDINSSHLLSLGSLQSLEEQTNGTINAESLVLNWCNSQLRNYRDWARVNNEVVLINTSSFNDVEEDFSQSLHRKRLLEVLLCNTQLGKKNDPWKGEKKKSADFLQAVQLWANLPDYCPKETLMAVLSCLLENDPYIHNSLFVHPDDRWTGEEIDKTDNIRDLAAVGIEYSHDSTLDELDSIRTRLESGISVVEAVSSRVHHTREETKKAFDTIYNSGVQVLVQQVYGAETAADKAEEEDMLEQLKQHVPPSETKISSRPTTSGSENKPALEEWETEKEEPQKKMLEVANFRLLPSNLSDLIDFSVLTPEEITETQNVITSNNVELWKVFSFYSRTMSGVSVSRMTASEFWKFVREARLGIPGLVHHGGWCMEIFQALLREGAEEPQSPDQKKKTRNPGEEDIHFGHFREALVRLAFLKFPEEKSLVKKVKTLVVNFVLVNCSKTAKNMTYLQTIKGSEVGAVFRRNNTLLKSLFDAYARLSPHQGQMAFNDFLVFLKDYSILNVFITNHDAKEIILHIEAEHLNKGKKKDEKKTDLAKGNDAKSLNYQEFLEFICAVSHYVIRNPYYPLHERVEKFVVAFVKGKRPNPGNSPM
mmetsp:Transcript_33518/g.65895  ORF Transcript_33518/g.65895 Transcript_33518/m.65895 type:complete len:996 (+) Transcript_33518:59-3046(+)